jgi:ADP-ribosylation factor related protein 1
MYHLLKGLHEYLTRYDTLTLFLTHRNSNILLHRKDEFSVIIIGLDGAGKTVRKRTLTHNTQISYSSLASSYRLSSRRSRLYIMTRRAYDQTKSSRRWARTVRIPTPLPLPPLVYRYSSCLYPLHTAGKIALPSAVLQFWDLGGQRGIRSIWPKYYDDCHAVVYVVDAVDHERLSEGWEVFGKFSFPSFLNANANADS